MQGSLPISPRKKASFDISSFTHGQDSTVSSHYDESKQRIPTLNIGQADNMDRPFKKSQPYLYHGQYSDRKHNNSFSTIGQQKEVTKSTIQNDIKAKRASFNLLAPPAEGQYPSVGYPPSYGVPFRGFGGQVVPQLSPKATNISFESKFQDPKFFKSPKNDNLTSLNKSMYLSQSWKKEEVKENCTGRDSENHQPKLFDDKKNYLKRSLILSPTSNIQMRPKFLSIKDFQIGQIKGDGQYGKVKVCRHRVTNCIYAMKEIPKSLIKKNNLDIRLSWEIKIQSFMSHPNLIKLYGYFSEGQNIYLIQEFAEGGNLFDLLKKNKTGLSEKTVSRHMREVCSAVLYMHDLQVAHRDIKPENVVICNGVAKLCDFGWSTLIDERRSTYCGTFDYTSPEMLQGKQYDESIDLWSLGVLTFELLTGKLPFYNISRKETIRNITSVKQITYPPDMSPIARSFIECLLQKQPEMRKDADMLLKHPFLEMYKEPTF